MATTNQVKKGIIFARVSTERQEKEGLSLKEIQLPKAQDYAKRKNIKIIEECVVSESAGGVKDRKEFDRLIRLLKDREDITEIISFRVDRITRNFRDAVTMNELRQKYDKNIHCIDDRLVLHKDSPVNDLTQWNVKVFLGQEYINKVTDDGNKTKYNKLERGELPWQAPYGYEHKVISEKPTVKDVVTVEPKATTIRLIHSKYSSGAYSCKSLAEAINKEYGTKFSKGRINMILRDKFYIGIMVDKKTGKEYPHFYETLVTRGTFERNQDLLEGRKNVRRRYAGIPSVYRGLIECSVCGCSITPDPRTKKQKNGNVHHYQYYHCSNGKSVHDKQVNTTETALNEDVMRLLKQLSLPKDKIEQLRKDLDTVKENKNDFYSARRRELAGRRKILSNRQEKSYDLLADQCITLEQYNKNNERYAEELAEIQMREDQLDNADQNFYTTAGYLLAMFECSERLFEVASIDEKREIVSLLLSNLKLDGKNFTFNLKEPFATLISQSKGSSWLSVSV